MQPPFDPDGPAVGSGIFGLPHEAHEAGVILIPVPWEATVSYRSGTAGGPEAILAASRQVDLFDRATGRPWEAGIAMLPLPAEVRAWNDGARRLARPVIEAGGVERPSFEETPWKDDAPTDPLRRAEAVDRLSTQMNAWVGERAAEWLDRGRLVGLVGGDHSTPFGLIREVAARRPGLGILHLDAHADLRRAYEGFRWSHASIMWNVLEEIPGVARLVQVGVRDFGEAEEKLIRESEGRIATWFDDDLRRRLQNGASWSSLAVEIVDALPSEVYLSFDIDGLDPSLCPHTGTPVPGGLSLAEAVSLLRRVAESGRTIVGFDLVEVAPDPTGDEWDANVGSRLLYKMIGYARRR